VENWATTGREGLEKKNVVQEIENNLESLIGTEVKEEGGGEPDARATGVSERGEDSSDRRRSLPKMESAQQVRHEISRGTD